MFCVFLSSTASVEQTQCTAEHHTGNVQNTAVSVCDCSITYIYSNSLKYGGTGASHAHFHFVRLN